MDFNFSEEQSMMRASALRFVEDHYDYASRRARIAAGPNVDETVWTQFVVMGWLAIGMSEENGGIGGSTADMLALLEPLGAALVVEPLIANAVLCADILAATGRTAELNLLLAGRTRFALAVLEAPIQPIRNSAKTTATISGGNYRLNGAKSAVHGASGGEQLLVVAEPVEGAAALFLVDSSNVQLTVSRLADGWASADIVMNDCQATLIADTQITAIIERALNRSIVALGAMALGSMRAVIEATIEHLKTRQQFGRPLSQFQVLRHRLADMKMTLELTRSLVLAAIAAEAAGSGLSTAASALKMQLGAPVRRVGELGIQLHGGLGVTSEYQVGQHYLRMCLTDKLFGDAIFHAQRFITSTGIDKPVVARPGISLHF
jgi:alkylation response protein AidB-like acyl-CoA dehydrogenase